MLIKNLLVNNSWKKGLRSAIHRTAFLILDYTIR